MSFENQSPSQDAEMSGNAVQSFVQTRIVADTETAKPANFHVCKEASASQTLGTRSMYWISLRVSGWIIFIQLYRWLESARAKRRVGFVEAQADSAHPAPLPAPVERRTQVVAGRGCGRAAPAAADVQLERVPRKGAAPPAASQEAAARAAWLARRLFAAAQLRFRPVACQSQ